MKNCQKSKPAQSQAIVRVGPMMSIPSILREHNCDPAPVLDSFGFKLNQFEDPDLELPYLPTSRLIARCVELTGCEHFGLLVGIRAEPSSLGLAGFMLQTAPDVGTALNSLLRHLELHDTGGGARLVTNGGATSLGYTIHVAGVSAAYQIYDQSMAIVCNIMRGLCGEDWNPDEVLLSRPPPHNPAPYRHFFKAPIRFNTAESAVIFPTRWLNYKLSTADHYLFDYLKKQAARLHQSQTQELIDHVHQFVRNTLIIHGCTASAAARHLGMHERTLNRRLQELGTNFRQEVNNVRYAMAKSFLSNSKATTAEIALALGYTDATAFSHAFKRWSSMSPAQWRTKNA